MLTKGRLILDTIESDLRKRKDGYSERLESVLKYGLLCLGNIQQGFCRSQLGLLAIVDCVEIAPVSMEDLVVDGRCN